MQKKSAKKKVFRVCTLVFSHYPADIRVRREAEALAEAGMSVDVICLKSPHEDYEEIIDGVRVLRMPVRQKRGGRLRYHWEYFAFVVLTFVKVTFIHMRDRYNLIHVHNMPDILVVSAMIPRLTGARILLDLHDPMPEVYMAKYAAPRPHRVVRLLRFLEKFSVLLAHCVITPNLAFRDLFVSRGCPPCKIHVIMNSPPEEVFKKVTQKAAGPEQRADNSEFVLMYHGTMVERNGIKRALEAVALLRERISNMVLHVYGDGDYRTEFECIVGKLELGDIVRYHGEVPLERIAEGIREIDCGLVPNESSTHWNLAFPTRIFEYLSLGKPVIVPRTKGIVDYFDEESIFFFESGNSKNMAEVIWEVYRNAPRRRAVLERGIAVYRAHRWDLQKKEFCDVVTELLGAR